nr:Retrovirus-related Pol polyprotein from transposon RE1 [Ipomoea batatas]
MSGGTRSRVLDFPVLSPLVNPAAERMLAPAAEVRTCRPNQNCFGPSFVNIATAHLLISTLKPKAVAQVLKDPMWRNAIDDEFGALLCNDTWVLIPRPSAPVIGYMWAQYISAILVKFKIDGVKEVSTPMHASDIFSPATSSDIVDVSERSQGHVDLIDEDIVDANEGLIQRCGCAMVDTEKRRKIG